LGQYQFFKFTESEIAVGFLKRLGSHGVSAIEYTYSGGFINIHGNKMNSFEDLKDEEVSHESYSVSYKKTFEELLHVKFVERDSNENMAPFTEIIASTLNEMEVIPNLDRIILNRTEHRVISRIIFINNKFLEKLPVDLKEIVLEEAKLAGQFERELAVAQTEVFLNSLKKKGLKVNNWTKKQKEIERTRFKVMYDAFVKKHGSRIIDEIDSTKI
jgi:TRAP-type C4-dicarboxylate transport system substrate-binding protein